MQRPVSDHPLAKIGTSMNLDDLERFVHEKTVSVNTTAAGGNAALMSQAESD